MNNNIQNYLKFFIISYDDGVIEDRQFISLLNKYHLIGTFHLNSGKLSKKHTIKRSEVKKLYIGHEISSHTVNHPYLTRCNKEDLIQEVVTDITTLKQLSNQEIHGMSYPFGDYNDEVIKELKKLGVLYSRTVEDTHHFEVPEDFLQFHPTCHHNNKEMRKLLDQFIKLDAKKIQVFTLWGHTYEFQSEEDWMFIENILQQVSHAEDILSISMTDFVKYINHKLID